jgi:sugar phosphate permease
MAVFCLLLWLPTFLKTELKYDDSQVANLSTVIDLGAMLGSIALGLISDLMHGKRSPVALVAVIFASALSFTLTYTVYPMNENEQYWLFFVLMFLLGFFISGLNNMISAACSADLGKQEALKGNTKAISTVTGIIDGTGTMGTAAGQFIVGFT